MKLSRKTALYVCALAIGILLAVALVRAASPGENFEWLAVSDGGILIGGSVGEGEGEGEQEPAPSNTLVFTPSATGDASAVMFQDGGGIGAVDSESMPETTLMFLTAEETLDDPAALLASGDVAMSSGHFEVASEGEGEGEEVDFVAHSSVICTSDGDVIIQLAHSAEGEGEESMMGDSAEGGLAQDAIGLLRRIPIRLPSLRGLAPVGGN